MWMNALPILRLGTSGVSISLEVIRVTVRPASNLHRTASTVKISMNAMIQTVNVLAAVITQGVDSSARVIKVISWVKMARAVMTSMNAAIKTEAVSTLVQTVREVIDVNVKMATPSRWMVLVSTSTNAVPTTAVNKHATTRMAGFHALVSKATSCCWTKKIVWTSMSV